jgi:phosphoserine phosphatase
MRWPYYEHVFFDCDSTLTTVEGIDVLADTAGKRWRVEVLTQAAMDGELDLEDIYEKRMRAVNPSHQQIRDIRRAYKQNIVEDAREIITVLQGLGHKVYIISGGLLEPVLEFGVFLGVPKEHIRAVEVSYNELSGNWWIGGDEQYLTFEDGALTVSDGKAEIVQEFLAGKRGRSLLVGDGYSDLLAGSAVNLFAGFGGVVKRERVFQEAPIFLNSTSLAPILAVAAGPSAVFNLNNSAHKALSQKSLELIEGGALKFNSQQVGERFNRAFQAAQFRSQSNASGEPGRPSALEDWISNV